MKINVHAGHNPDGRIGCGAVGIIRESTENRKVKDEVIRLMRSLGHTVYDCTVDDGKNASDVLKKIVRKCNTHEVDLDVSIHFNAGRNDYTGDGKTGGTEVYLYNAGSKAAPYAAGVADAIADLGYLKRKDNSYPVAGVHVRPSLYVLKNTKSPALLIECCFVDDKDDVQRYDYLSMARAIVQGITGTCVKEDTVAPAEDLMPEEGVVASTTQKLYRVQVGAYASKANAEKMLQQLKAAGMDAIMVSV